MTRRLTVFVILLTILIFIIGCPSSATKPAKPTKTEPAKTEPVKAAPVNVEPVKPEPIEPQPTEPERNEPEPQPNEPEPLPTKPEPNEPQPQPVKIEPPKPEVSPATRFHDKCNDILSTFVDSRAMADYKALKRKKPQLKHLLDDFANLDPNEYNSWPKQDKIAFWLNAHNIQKLNIIIRNYPIDSARIRKLLWMPTSIRHIPPVETIGVSKWDGYKFIVRKEQFTLSEIERKFFRKEFNEPRAFFALSGASRSGPLLRNEPYYGHKLQAQLDDQVKKFLSNPRAFKIDRKKQKVYLSAIFTPNWYGREFIRKYSTNKMFKNHPAATRAVLNFITNYISDEDASYLKTGNYDVKYIGYDWRLNDK